MAKPVASQGDGTDPEIEHADGSVSSRGESVKVELKDEAGEKDTSPVSQATPASGKSQATSEPDRSAEERRWKALESQVAATRRINEDLRKQVSQLNERLQTPAQATGIQGGAQALPAGTSQETINQYDKLVQDGKWQDAVKLLAREEYKTARDIESAQAQVQRVEERRLTALERSKQKVEMLYPTLHRETGNPDSTETQLFNEAVAELSQEDEQFLHDPYAPVLAMTRMEELARERGVTLTRSSSKTPSGAPSSPRRAGTGSLPVSRGTGGSMTYTLTPEQKAFADASYPHLPETERYKTYARFARTVETTGGVET